MANQHIDKEFPVYVKGSGTKPTLWVQARDYMGPAQVVIERQNAGLVVLNVAEARALIEVLGQAVEALEPPAAEAT
jgi:hypothetical protein